MAGSVAVALMERSQVPRPAVVARRDVEAARWDRRHRADLAAPHLAEVPAAAHRVSVAAVPDVLADGPAAAHPVSVAVAPDVPVDGLAAAHRVSVAVAPDVLVDGLAAAHPVSVAAAPDVPAGGLAAARPVWPWVPLAVVPPAVFAAGPVVAVAASYLSPARLAAPARRQTPQRAARRGLTPARRQRGLSPRVIALLRLTSDPNSGWCTEVQKAQSS